MTLTKNEVPTVEERRQFSHEKFHPPFSNGANICWVYCDSKGKLYSGTAFSAELAKANAEEQSGEKINGAPNGSVSKAKGGVA